MQQARGSTAVLLAGLAASAAVIAALVNARPAPAAPPATLTGWVDLHTHPLVHLGFGGKLIAGGVDVGSTLPADQDCHHNVVATSWQQALGNDRAIQGGWNAFENGCGDAIREQVIQALETANGATQTSAGAHGSPDFTVWPAYKDITHQKMWVDWIRRARDGGERVLIALAVNNKTIGDAVAGPGDYSTDDKSSADRELRATVEFVRRHPDFMEIAYAPADLQRIVSSGKLAVVLGVEIDDIGDLNAVSNPSEAAVTAELDRLYNEGVRYVFPVHVIDNPFGGTAVYTGAFNLSNYREAGHFWELGCSAPGDQITYHYAPDGFDLAVAAVKAVKLQIDIARNPPDSPNCPSGTGHVNTRGLTPLGEFAINQMMKKGLIVDIDHMSQRSADRALELAEAVPDGGYPLVSGHTGIRGINGANAENSRTVRQLQRLAALHGMFGLGTAEQNAYGWIGEYAHAVHEMPTPGAVTMGTDLNGLVKAPPPRPGSSVAYTASFPRSSLGSRTWDYNHDGVAHYGLLAEYVRDMRTAPNGANLVDNYLDHSADYFWHMWERAESQRGRVGLSATQAAAMNSRQPVQVNAAPGEGSSGRGAVVVNTPNSAAPAVKVNAPPGDANASGRGAVVVNTPNSTAPAGASAKSSPPSSAPAMAAPAKAAPAMVAAPIRAATPATASLPHLKLTVTQGRGSISRTWWVLVTAVDAASNTTRSGIIKINGVVGSTGQRVTFRECASNPNGAPAGTPTKCTGVVSVPNYVSADFAAGPGS